MEQIQFERIQLLAIAGVGVAVGVCVLDRAVFCNQCVSDLDTQPFCIAMADQCVNSPDFADVTTSL